MKKKLNDFFGSSFHKKVFFICLVISIILLCVSWVMPPPWEISMSVITAVGELFAFAALGEVCAAIERGHRATISKGDVSLSVGSDDDNDNDIDNG